MNSPCWFTLVYDLILWGPNQMFTRLFPQIKVGNFVLKARLFIARSCYVTFCLFSSRFVTIQPAGDFNSYFHCSR